MKPGCGRVSIINSTFIQTRLQRGISSNACFVNSESAGPIIITNSSFTANVNRRFSPILAARNLGKVNVTSIFRCPTRRQVKLEKYEEFKFKKKSDTCRMKLDNVKLFCEECSGEFYSLQRELATGLDISKGSKRTVCLKCPYGASCENGNVKAKKNFWGFNISTNPPRVKLFPCPLEYCSSPNHSRHNTFNGCHGSRSGVLCGNCSDGYNEALLVMQKERKMQGRLVLVGDCPLHFFLRSVLCFQASHFLSAV